jgi:tripartite ATP-independent transporter DctM subunit
MFRDRTRVRLLFLASLAGFCASVAMAGQTFASGMDQTELSPFLYLPIRWFILVTSFGFFCAAVGFLFQVLHSLRDLWDKRDHAGIILPLAALALLIALPFLYRASGFRLSGLIIGALCFLTLFSLLLLRVPIAFAMAFMGILGLICLKRTPFIALATVGDIPYLHTADFVYVAIPMFMLMGELAFYSGISSDLFECANRWLGRLPGGLAAATVGGCAGFGAVCGESLPTVITMSSVALPPMRAHNYHPALATGVLAAGGTLGILIPPSIGFIFYSIMTEESIGKLFIAGILPGILLAAIFMGIIAIQASRNPALAPKSDIFTLREKLVSTVYLAPVAGLFLLVVGGIMQGIFTPGEGGAVGAAGAFLYALARRRLTVRNVLDACRNTALMSGKIFLIFAGVYIFGQFLANSRLPLLMAESILQLDVNRYYVLAIIIVLYIILGCVMNIIPMMLLTLPTIYPTVQALEFNGIWFGVITVMLMEMGLITPPVGMNVFTLSSLAPDIPMAVIFKGVMPFVLAMFFTIILIVIFPGIATWLPDLLMG